MRISWGAGLIEGNKRGNVSCENNRCNRPYTMLDQTNKVVRRDALRDEHGREPEMDVILLLSYLFFNGWLDAIYSMVKWHSVTHLRLGYVTMR